MSKNAVPPPVPPHVVNQPPALASDMQMVLDQQATLQASRNADPKVEQIANFIAASDDPNLVRFLMIDEIDVTSPSRRL